MQAKGEFEVTRIPQQELDIGGDASVGHSRFDKRFHGPLQATSVVRGELDWNAAGTDMGAGPAAAVTRA